MPNPNPNRNPDNISATWLVTTILSPFHYLYRFAFYYTFEIYKLSTLLRTGRKGITFVRFLCHSFFIHIYQVANRERQAQNKTETYKLSNLVYRSGTTYHL